MNKGLLTIGIIMLSLVTLLLLNVLTNYSTGSELDYYLLKETTDAAMSDALDSTYYDNCGVYRIDKEKFVESFLYRFASNVDITRSYKVGFYDINEVPPKVSVKVDSLTSFSFNRTDKDGKTTNEAANITTNYDAIIESNNYINVPTEFGEKTNSEICKGY